MDPVNDGTGAESRLEAELHALCVARLEAAGRPWRESLNKGGERALSCMQAVRLRDRLGSGDNGGIPLWAEMKSIVGIAVSADGRKTIPYAAHTRANTRIDQALLIRALGLDAEATSLGSRVDEDGEFEDHPLAGIVKATRERWFGLVNPFSVDRVLSDFADLDISLADVVQVFDVSLSLPGGVPDTVMTNLGDRKRAMELAPVDIIGAVRAMSCETHVHEIAVPCPIWLGQGGTYRKDVFMNWPPPTGPRIGILTGNGPESGLLLWQDMITAVRKLYPQVPDVLMPEVVVHSVPAMGLSMELIAREDQVRQTVVRGIRDLLRQDCRLVTIACNTTIHFEHELAALCSDFGARFISISEAAVPAASRTLATQPSSVDVGLIGIGPVIDLAGRFSGYRRRLEDAGISVTTRAADNFAFEIKNQPVEEEDSRVSAFERLIRTLPESIGVVILAVTEASLVYRDYVRRNRRHPDHRVYVDALAELGTYVAFTYLVAGYLESEVCQITDESVVSTKLHKALGWTDETPTSDHAVSAS